MNPNLDAALRLHDKGFSIIPIRPHDKKPLIPWEPFMKARPTEDQIEEWFTRHPDANIAFITGAISGVDILDIDTQAGREKMDEILPEQMETPVVLTPRGGQHYYMEHTPGMRRMIKFVDGCDFLGDNGYALTPPSIGGSGRQYIYAPGMSVFDHDPMPIPEKLKQILLNNSSYNKGCNSSPELEELERVSRITLKFDDGTRDNDIFHAALMMLKGGMSHDNVLICLKILSNNCTPPFPEKEMMQKFESALKRVSSKERNIAGEIREWVRITNGVFRITDAYQDVSTITSEEKNRVRVAIHRMCEEGILERVPGKYGYYRRIETECDDIDFINVDSETEGIILPFGLHNLVDLQPNNVIIVAGEPDAGKTALLLNIVKFNMHKYDVWYFSSEMFGKEFNTRLRKFEGIQIHEWKFHPKERSSDFADVIRPGRGKINIIDFLEVYKDFYEVGGLIAEIHRKLDGAIAIIALQKNPGASLGIGGARGLEKARLYVNMTRQNRIEIVKAKNWRDSRKNPNGLVRDYRIHAGCNLEARTDWFRPSK